MTKSLHHFRWAMMKFWQDICSVEIVMPPIGVAIKTSGAVAPFGVIGIFL